MRIKIDRQLLIEALKKELKEREAQNRSLKESEPKRIEDFRREAIDVCTRAIDAIKKAKTTATIDKNRPSDSYNAAMKWPSFQKAEKRDTCSVERAIHSLSLSKEANISMDENDTMLQYVSVCKAK